MNVMHYSNNYKLIRAKDIALRHACQIDLTVLIINSISVHVSLILSSNAPDKLPSFGHCVLENDPGLPWMTSRRLMGPVERAQRYNGE